MKIDLLLKKNNTTTIILYYNADLQYVSTTFSCTLVFFFTTLQYPSPDKRIYTPVFLITVV